MVWMAQRRGEEHADFQVRRKEHPIAPKRARLFPPVEDEDEVQQCLVLELWATNTSVHS